MYCCRLSFFHPYFPSPPSPPLLSFLLPPTHSLTHSLPTSIPLYLTPTLPLSLRVNVDVDVPLFLPIYGQRRLHDLRRIAGREIRENFRINGQMNFDSGINLFSIFFSLFFFKLVCLFIICCACKFIIPPFLSPFLPPSYLPFLTPFQPSSSKL